MLFTLNVISVGKKGVFRENRACGRNSGDGNDTIMYTFTLERLVSLLEACPHFTRSK